MSSTREENGARGGFRLSLDGWAVLIAILLALAVRLAVIKTVPW
jgi:hypothetical protein